MEITFLTPLGVFVALAVLFPLFMLYRGWRKNRSIAKQLELSTPSARLWFLGLVLQIRPKQSRAPFWVTRGAILISVGALVGLAGAQPAVRFSQSTRVCSGAEVIMVFDTSRSMIASTSFEAQTRLTRAKVFAKQLRSSIDCVPTGIASLTDRVLPHLFPTTDIQAFSSVVDDVIAIEHPPPAGYADRRSTNLEALSDIVDKDFFTPGMKKKKLVVVLTDGESDSYNAAQLSGYFRQAKIELVFIHVWGPHERVFTPEGKPEIYRSDPLAVARMEAFTRVMKSPFIPENQGIRAAQEVRHALGELQSAQKETKPREVLLAPYLIALAILVSALLLSRNIATLVSAVRWKREKK